jgi:hypothetical protein
MTLLSRRLVKLKERKAPSDRDALIGNREPALTPEQIEGYNALGKLAQMRAAEAAKTPSPVEVRRKAEQEREQLTWQKVLARR